uniref:Fam-a protein n=1 Tax=Strongyloides venezuelensis TaxID=75913 RepID=A0A0K0F3N8_STRVS
MGKSLFIARCLVIVFQLLIFGITIKSLTVQKDYMDENTDIFKSNLQFGKSRLSKRNIINMPDTDLEDEKINDFLTRKLSTKTDTYIGWPNFVDDSVKKYLEGLNDIMNAVTSQKQLLHPKNLRNHIKRRSVKLIKKYIKFDNTSYETNSADDNSAEYYETLYIKDTKQKHRKIK